MDNLDGQNRIAVHVDRQMFGGPQSTEEDCDEDQDEDTSCMMFDRCDE